VSLRSSELAAVAEGLSRVLAGAMVQKVSNPAPLRVEFELRQPGRSTRLLVCAEPSLARISVVAARVPVARPPSSWLLRLRKELVGAHLVHLASTGAREVELAFERKGLKRTLVLEAGGTGALLLLGNDRQPLAAAGERERAPRRPTPHPDKPPTSRLPKLADGLALGQAVEALFSEEERSTRAAALRRQRVQPLRARVDRLRRTLEKVRAEASRSEAAEQHRRFGELLRQNVEAVPRGAAEVTLVEYTSAGVRQVVVPLEPGLDLRSQAERHFQRYRRLTRGSARACQRLRVLEGELAGAEVELAAARAVPDDALLASAPAADAGRARKPRSLLHQPYRVFHSQAGDRILVGRAGRDNEALTFGLARPNDVWLHARGIPGAHVLIPLSRGAEVSQETLLDAAHLALHHSRGAGADHGEVSYTRAKYVRREKGGAPGAVTYTREKTFLVRLQAERLERLLASREDR
jgi:predicted ribosome quality control (RQC) complex YloA/Tae2 family protein